MKSLGGLYKVRMDKRKRERSATILIFKAFLDLYGKEYLNKVEIEFSTGNGVYFRTGFPVTEGILEGVELYVKDIIENNESIEKCSMRTEAAIEIFSSMGYEDKVKLLTYRRSTWINVHEFLGYRDYFYGSLAKKTGEIGDFKLEKYRDGFVLIVPEEDGAPAPDFVHNEKVHDKLEEDDTYLSNIGINSVADINEFLLKQKTNELILVQEAYMEKKIGDVANKVLEKGKIKFVMIAGPSSSGKTTFSKRLAVHLKANGLCPHTIEVDNYFKRRVDTPKNPDGTYNFETIEALDVEKFNEDMLALIRGEEVETPRFNFITGEREYKGDFLKLSENDILVIEGIHCLNDKMSYRLDKELKFKIYISALSSLNIDKHNRIATTDLRLIRRMVRDARTRGADAKKTISMWKSVRKGEEEYIFPFQNDADIVFNSALCYELPVLKTYVEPLLFSVERGSSEYEAAKRLLKFLDYFLVIPSDSIPNNSIIKEFIGGSCFSV